MCAPARMPLCVHKQQPRAERCDLRQAKRIYATSKAFTYIVITYTPCVRCAHLYICAKQGAAAVLHASLVHKVAGPS